MAALRKLFIGSREPVRHVTAAPPFADEVLQQLRADGYTVRAWWTFWERSWWQFADAARLRSRAVAEVHLLHAALLASTRDPRALISWSLTLTHVGLLPAGGGLGIPNTLSLLRANLPIIAPSRPGLVATVALVTDFADGVLARRINAETPFGAYADPLADAVFWIWFVRRYEQQRWLRRAAFLLWLAPPAALIGLSFARGRIAVVPRPMLVRTLSAGLQATLALRALRGRFGRS